MNGEYLDISTNAVTLTEEQRKKAYMKEWREKHREHIKEYNKQHHIKIRQETSDTYYIVSELRALKRLQEQENKTIMDTIANYMETIRQENTSLRKYVNELLKEADDAKFNSVTAIEEQSPVPQIDFPVNILKTEELQNKEQERTPTQSPAPVIPEIPENKKIKKIRKVRVKKPVSPALSVTSVESYSSPSKFTKNLIDEVLDDLIDSDGNLIMSESDY
jgi:hypothetical protein